MEKNNDEKIIEISDSLAEVGEEIIDVNRNIIEEINDEKKQREELNELVEKAQFLAKKHNVKISEMNPLEVNNVSEINISLDILLEIECNNIKTTIFPKLSMTDILISSIAGLVASVLDIVLVGTPEVVKLAKGGERFDGSILTSAFRKLGEGPLKGFAEQLSKICKVPYDLSAVKGGMIPDNHRLRSLSHDPFFGLFFSIFDIVFNTTTFIDNSGCLRIMHSPSGNKELPQKFLSVFYFIGHIISDMFTSRGIPVPGFFLTQFFTNGEPDTTIARIAENMYKDGFDLRHLTSMSVPVMVKDIILSSYFYLTEKDEIELHETKAIKEKRLLNIELRKTKMTFIADGISVSGNVAKFFLPPYCCNPNSLNTVEWFSFLRSNIKMLSAVNRDMDTEQALHNRSHIDNKWNDLLSCNNSDDE